MIDRINQNCIFISCLYYSTKHSNKCSNYKQRYDKRDYYMGCR